MNVSVVDYPGLSLQLTIARWPAPLGEHSPPPWLGDLLRLDAKAPFVATDEIRGLVRDLLRRHGYRPTGRGKPSAEYLRAAVGEGRLSLINAAVDVGNVASLHSGLPISVVDLDKVQPPLRVDVPAAGSSYVFNRSGQTIDVGGLLSLFDAEGPCANAVKDAQRTKTDEGTSQVMVVVWGAAEPAGHAAATAGWVRELLTRAGAVVEVVG
jgi:DNA/RNA-binding domain of Phe-tRNA-synthetase-like protein